MTWTERRQPGQNPRAAAALRLLLAFAGGACFAWLSWTTPENRSLSLSKGQVPPTAWERRESPDNTVANASHDRRATDGNAISAPGGPQRSLSLSKGPYPPARVGLESATSQMDESLIPPKGNQASLTPTERSAARTADPVASAIPADDITGRAIQSAGMTPHPNPRAPPPITDSGWQQPPSSR